MTERRKVYVEQDEKLFSTTEIQKEFGKGDKKGRAKKNAARADRQNLRQRVAANGGTVEQANQAIATTGPKASKAGEIAAPKVNAPKTTTPKKGSNFQKQLEAAKNKASKVVDQTAKQSKGLFNKALNAAKNNPKAAAGIGAGIAAAGVGTGMIVKRSKKNADQENV